MSTNWKPLTSAGRRIAGWLRAPQPRCGTHPQYADADARRARADLDAVRARFTDLA